MYDLLEHAAAVLARPRLYENEEDQLAAEALVSIVLRSAETGEDMPLDTERMLLAIAKKLIVRSMIEN